MPYNTTISAQQLLDLQASEAPLKIFDCSFDLNQPDAGMAMFLDTHIAGAIYVHLDHDLSAKTPAQRVQAASGGRHPLPAREQVAQWLSQIGFNNSMQAVVYDRQGNNFCGRLWWMLQWLGHENVAILDGGLPAWYAVNGSMQSGPTPPPCPARFELHNPLVPLVGVDTVTQQLGHDSQTLIDARASARFKGDVEPIDPVAGHIPGALNRPYIQNMTADGLFKPAAQLRQEFEQLLQGRNPASVVHHCGSGVSAIPNLIAMQIAGLGATGLFAGSWSEWCSHPERPVEKG
jgi:thiosulfate/3-mercaptopyruvate sulfurtransferase